MTKKLPLYFLTFVFYAFIGGVLQDLYCSIADHIFGKDWVAHNFLQVLPLTPVFGFGALFLILFFNRFTKLKRNILLTFLWSALICAVVEFGTGELLALVLGSNKLWNYAGEPFNFMGQICLQNTILFGIGGLIIIKYLQPWWLRFIERRKIAPLAVVMVILLLIDTIYSVVRY